MLTAHAAKLLKSDWMVWQVMHAVARHYYPDDPLRQTLISWLLMHQAGYAVRVGYYDSGVQLLLNWLQHMPYATDQEQFGEENYLLPDEIFFYGASDCEDRAVLYVHWARALFGDQGLGLIALD